MTKEAIQQQMAAVRVAREQLQRERDKLARMLEEARAELTYQTTRA